MSSRGQNTLFVGLVAAVLLSLIAFGAAQAFSFNGTVSGPSPVHKNADGIVEYSVIHAAHASDDWDDPVVVERRVVAEKPADTVYKAKTEVVSDKSITKKAKIFRGKEKRGIFGRIFGGKKQQANDAAFNHELASVGQKSSTQQDEFGIPSDALGSAPALVSDSTVDGSAATGIYTSEIDWKANEYKIPSANKKATKKNARKDAFALSTQEKRDLGLESGVHYENDLIQAMGLKADSAESAKLRKSLQASSGQVQDNSISSDHRKLLSELETLKKQDSLSAEATARLERQKEARRLLRVKQELMLELHEQKKAKARTPRDDLSKKKEHLRTFKTLTRTTTYSKTKVGSTIKAVRETGRSLRKNQKPATTTTGTNC